MPVTLNEWLPYLLAFLAGWALFAALHRRGATRTAKRRARRSANAEADAEALLHAAGFRVLDRQVTGVWPLDVGGEPTEAVLRADLLVERRRRVYVAEVKSGRAGARPTHPGTRRQLLEYRLAFECDGVLLVDMVERTVVEVDFPGIDFD